MTDQLDTDLASLRIDRSKDTELPVNAKSTGPSHMGGRVARTAVSVFLLAALASGGALAAPRVLALVSRQEVTADAVRMTVPSHAEVSLTSTGYVVAENVSHVGSKVMGRLSRMLVKEGDTVKQGDLLAVIDDSDVRAVLGTAGARVSAAQARAELMRANQAEVLQQLERERRLVAKGAVPEATLQDLEAKSVSSERAVETAAAEARAAQSELKPLSISLSDHNIVAPISGVVFTKPPGTGEVVSPGGKPVAEIFDPASLVVETEVPEARLSLAKPDSPCEIVLDAYPARRIRGVVTEIGHRVDRAKATVTVKVKFVDPASDVIPDMSARTSFISQPLSEQDQAAKPKRVVSVSAVAERDGKKVVFVIDGERVRAVPVTLGEEDGSTVELVVGPAVGAKLVAAPSASLVTGQLIKEKRD